MLLMCGAFIAAEAQLLQQQQQLVCLAGEEFVCIVLWWCISYSVATVLCIMKRIAVAWLIPAAVLHTAPVVLGLWRLHVCLWCLLHAFLAYGDYTSTCVCVCCMRIKHGVAAAERCMILKNVAGGGLFAQWVVKG